MDINIDESEIERRLAERRAKKAGIPLKGKVDPVISSPVDSEPDNSPIEHYLMPKMRAIIATRRNLYLPGPSGSGKSEATRMVAEQLELPFYCPPVGRETTNAQLFGYYNVQGQYVRTSVREAYEFGGVLHFEEIDFASPAVGTALNALLANKVMGFDITVPRHKDFIIVASANTYGTGANAQYIGSQGLNAATLNRFVFLEFPYDEKMERRIAPNLEWTNYVIRIRKAVAILGLKHVVSPRQSLDGCALISTGMFAWEEIEMMTLFKGLNQHTIEKIKATPVF